MLQLDFDNCFIKILKQVDLKEVEDELVVNKLNTIRDLLKVGIGPYAGFEHECVVDNKTAVGIEIELEEYINSRWHPTIPCEYWEKINDGSLRPRELGAEFITKGKLVRGIVGDEIFKALEYFGQMVEYNLKERNLLPTISDRCSVHVHVNAGDLTVKQLYNIIIVYLIFEKVLFKYCDINRYYNNYCIPLVLNHPLLELLDVDDCSKYTLQKLCGKSVKYSALNLKCLLDKGTIEFRQHPGCYDWNRLLKWVNIILKLKTYAVGSNKSWLDIISSVSGKGPEVFLQEVFGEFANLLKYDGVYDDIIEGVRDAQMIEYRKKIAAVEANYNL